MSAPLLEVRDLSIAFPAAGGEVRPVRGVSLDVQRGRRVAVVGESGSGKSLTALAVMGLIRPPGRLASGTISLNGRDLRSLSPREAVAVRGGEMAMVYQNPLTALNPLWTVGRQIVEAIRTHLDLDRRAARERAIELLAEVGIHDPARRFGSYPHEFSGGMLQRVVIAMALSTDPDLLIADEATTALDVTTQARIVELLLRLVSERGVAIMFITHDLGVAATLCEDICVMYAGRIVEHAPAEAFYAHPVHPYSEALLGATCGIDAPTGEPLLAVRGQPPLPDAFPAGCAFHPRCPYAVDKCAVTAPSGIVRDGRHAECHLAGERFGPHSAEATT